MAFECKAKASTETVKVCIYNNIQPKVSYISQVLSKHWHRLHILAPTIYCVCFSLFWPQQAYVIGCVFPFLSDSFLVQTLLFCFCYAHENKKKKHPKF